ncbi:hypothetical protein SAMN05518849_13115 [Sphingobium sp. AP50]|uniref:hypothetical protein n=1 Tax=Sphingobium sp. AP50 TaxID=1884369 RepID=UPI0008CC10FB|nr:hypothetical protein [Sphingobium sp. AP50]SEK03573.1 hypothetical protein SAMN05518849_13115 [Sphingobium sp. AP50]
MTGAADQMSAADFIARAIEFLPAIDGPRFPEIRLHHASIAFELATKAAILHSGGSHAECLTARHDLDACLATARRRGFNAAPEAHYAARTLTPFYKTHSLAQLVREPGALALDQLCAEAAAHVAQVDAWMQDDNKTKV